MGILTLTDTHTYDADNTVTHETFQVRLVNGRKASEGLVEVSRDGTTWGTVCDDSWTLENANVVCRQLGYDRATAAYSNAFFGSGGNISIFLDDVACFGTEARLDQCYSSEWNVHNCNHNEDAGVSCYGKEWIRDGTVCTCTYT